MQQDLLEPFLVSCHLGPCLARVGAKVLHYRRDTLSQFVVGGCQVEFEVQCVGGFEEVGQRLDLVMDARGGVELGQVWTIHLIPREGLNHLSEVKTSEEQGVTHVEINIERLHVYLSMRREGHTINA